jgi:cellulose synthase/poly-beta-1,6-N-acetylglucosamine synthase-like glycosyltransferase
MPILVLSMLSPRLNGDPGAAHPQSYPLVSVAMPCRDEERYIENCIRAVQGLDWPRDRLEILVADGMSIDATREILARLAAEDPRIRLIDNPARIQAAGLNECIRRARGEVIVRMDVHADYATDFVRQCVAALDRTGADNVGGAARPRARSFFQRCVGVALYSPLGIGGSSYRKPCAEGFVESVWPGAFRREVFERVGLFDPHAVTNEDAELNQRIVGAGGRVYLSRDIVVFYYPRGSPGALARQYFKYGLGRARTLLKHRRLLAVRPALPFLWLSGEALLFATSPWPFGAWSVAAYALITGAEAVRVIARADASRSFAALERVLAVPVVWGIFPILHASHGAGFAVGLVKYALHPDWGPDERLAAPAPRAQATAAE